MLGGAVFTLAKRNANYLASMSTISYVARQERLLATTTTTPLHTARLPLSLFNHACDRKDGPSSFTASRHKRVCKCCQNLIEGHLPLFSLGAKAAGMAAQEDRNGHEASHQALRHD